MWGALGNTLSLVAAVIALSVPAGSVAAWLCVCCEWPGRRWVVRGGGGLLFLPLFLQASAWDAALGRQGWIGPCVGWGGVPLIDGWMAAIFLHAVTALPWVVLIVGLGLREVEPELIEQGLLDAPPPCVAWRVLLPRCRGAVAVAAAWVAVLVSSDMTVTDMFQIRTFAEVLYTDFALEEDPAMVAAHLAPGIVALGAVIAGLLATAWSWQAFSKSIVRRRPARCVWGGWWAAGGLGSATLLLVGLPLGSLVLKLGWVAAPLDGRWVRSWSAAHAVEILGQTPREFSAEWLWTAGLAGLAATLSTVVVLPLAWWLRNSATRIAGGLILGALLAAVPGPYIAVLALAARVHWGGEWLEELAEHTLLLPALALAVRSAPICGAMAWQAWRSLPQAMLDMARLDGMGTWRQVWQIAWPERRRSIAAIWLVAWCLAAGDVAATILLVPTRVSTVAVRTFQLVHAGVDDRLAGLCLLSTGVFGLLAWGVSGMARKDRAWE